MPLSLRDRIARHTPGGPGWRWLWRLEEAVFGRLKPVNIDAEVTSMTGLFQPSLSALSLGPPIFSGSNGLQVWLLPADKLKVLRAALRQTPGADSSFRPRISTADGIEAQLFQGQSILLNGTNTPVGCTFGCCARLYYDFTDLMAYLTLSELVTNEARSAQSPPLDVVTIRTNLDTRLRLQVPKGAGIFFFDQGFHGSASNHTGLIIESPQPVTKTENRKQAF
jgi:hypothetical protein